ncbi:MAG: helix-turn-helix domain-containing protein [Sinimarinibacterium sp.]|jgi:transcriptional regulator with XRE-family HTH domain
MNVNIHVSDSTTLREVGARLTARRLSLNLTQADLSEQAGVPKRTIERLEAGAAATRLSAFIRVCLVLGLRDWLEQLLAEPAPSPVEQLKLRGRTRKRASRRTDPDGVPKPRTDAEAPSKRKRWVWEP